MRIRVTPAVAYCPNCGKSDIGFYQSYFVKSALGTGYSFKPLKDGNAVDASNINKISSTVL
jgi:hypothetical protein